MKLRLKRKVPSPALVVASLALAVALSGTGYAVTVLPRNSVGAAQLKANAVNSKKVKNGSLRKADFKAGQLPAGPVGTTGEKGEPGTPGTNASINGVAAGGDLTGTYPAPTVGPDAIGGAEVAPNSLTAADINTSTLGFVTGVRRASEGFVAAGSFVDTTVPNLGTLRINCGASAQSGSVEWRKEYYANYQNLVAQYASEGSAPVTDGVLLQFGDIFTAAFPASATADQGRRAAFQLATYGSGAITATASLNTASGGGTGSCWYVVEVLSNQ